MTVDKPRLLLVDSYDSFTHNLAALCQEAIPNVSVTIIKNDAFTIQDLRPYLPYFSCVVVGPGPGSPDIPEDIGLVKDLWKLKESDVLPIFGVCLGLQSLAIEHGAILKRLHTVKHGQMSQIHHLSTDLFDDVGLVKAVRYHSLHVELKEAGEVEELAWAEDEENGKVVMALRHKHRPFWAVQYHPESVCTEGGGIQVVSNFWRLAQDWIKDTGRRTTPWKSTVGDIIGHPWPYTSAPSRSITPNACPGVTISSPKRLGISTIDICEAFDVSEESSHFVLLESAAQPGRFSIVGSISSSTLHIKYRVGDPSVCLTEDGKTSYEKLGSQDIWTWLAGFMRLRKVDGGNPELPFWGGLVGCLSYELGVHSMHVPLKRAENTSPGINIPTVVVDLQTGRTYVQSITPNDHAWVMQTVAMLENLPSTPCTMESILPQHKPSVTLPDKALYISKIREAKEHLFAGDSYELCLTAQTRISVPSSSSKSPSTSWERYKRLRKSNPAPHSAYLRLHPTTLLSSSPERFLSFSRAPGSVCQLRPIKGTVRKTPHVTRAIAEQALVGSPKEVAENLMIVDLIRHDLHGVVGEDVVVKQFCSVEEYETVWQLVSVIEGKRSNGTSQASGAEDQLGWQVLKQCLPPGSMTGAPKKRSVEILQNLEHQERGVYSGVFGYWCVGGGGDWSVTIRSCFKYQDDRGSRPDDLSGAASEEWVVGAGGAITALSDPEGEWEEMIIKLQSVLRAFGALS
ncbi:ADC synthase [Flammula alnicola]|nr:ADC synthase [Flammula alnicola]